jgi:hypothetical protein
VPDSPPGHAAMSCGIELSADEILREPDDQVVVYAHLHVFPEWPLALACASAVGDISALSVHPLSRAVLVEQADGNAQRRDAPASEPLVAIRLAPSGST